DDNLALVHTYGHPDASFYGLVTQSRIAMAQRDDAKALRALSQARAAGHDSGSDRFALVSDLEYMRFLLQRNRVEEAHRLAHEHGLSLSDKLPAGPVHWDRCEALRAIMRLRLAAGVGDLALAAAWT